MASHKLTFRPEIEGLRALAVLAVIAFHLEVSGLPGGYLGVDVFFVISGFLITSIITGELAEGCFSVLAFYKRRVARILPALLVMLMLVLAWGFYDAIPPQAGRLGKSSFSATVFASNFYFAKNTSYFGEMAGRMPLLHTWSLGVEEQFYLLFPVLLMLLWPKGGRAVRLAIAVMVAVSLGLFVFNDLAPDTSARLMRLRSSDGAFYLFPLRIWELGIGALVALGTVPRIRGRIPREVLAALGLAMAIATFFAGSATRQNPFLALACCSGIGLFIACARGTFAARALSLPPVRLVGRISYSVYLYHYPLIVFHRLRTGDRFEVTEQAVLAALALLLGGLSYVLVERPVLRRAPRESWRKVMGLGLAATVVTAAASLALVAYAARNGGVSGPALAVLSRSVEMRRQGQGTPTECMARGTDRARPGAMRECLAVDPERVNIALLGDSHAAHLGEALVARAPSIRFVRSLAGGCPPLMTADIPRICDDFVAFSTGPLLDDRRIKAVILSARWNESQIEPLAGQIERFKARGLRVVVFGPNLELQEKLPDIIARMHRDGRPLSDIADYIDPDGIALNRVMKARVQAAGARYIDLIAIQCPGGECRFFSPSGDPMSLDSNHFTQESARWIVSGLDPSGWVAEASSPASIPPR